MTASPLLESTLVPVCVIGGRPEFVFDTIARKIAPFGLRPERDWHIPAWHEATRVTVTSIPVRASVVLVLKDTLPHSAIEQVNGLLDARQKALDGTAGTSRATALGGPFQVIFTARKWPAIQAGLQRAGFKAVGSTPVETIPRVQRSTPTPKRKSMRATSVVIIGGGAGVRGLLPTLARFGATLTAHFTEADPIPAALPLGTDCVLMGPGQSKARRKVAARVTDTLPFLQGPLTPEAVTQAMLNARFTMITPTDTPTSAAPRPVHGRRMVPGPPPPAPRVEPAEPDVDVDAIEAEGVGAEIEIETPKGDGPATLDELCKRYDAYFASITSGNKAAKNMSAYLRRLVKMAGNRPLANCTRLDVELRSMDLGYTSQSRTPSAMLGWAHAQGWLARPLPMTARPQSHTRHGLTASASGMPDGDGAYFWRFYGVGPLAHVPAEWLTEADIEAHLDLVVEQVFGKLPEPEPEPEPATVVAAEPVAVAPEPAATPEPIVKSVPALVAVELIAAVEPAHQPEVESTQESKMPTPGSSPMQFFPMDEAQAGRRMARGAVQNPTTWAAAAQRLRDAMRCLGLEEIKVVLLALTAPEGEFDKALYAFRECMQASRVFEARVSTMTTKIPVKRTIVVEDTIECQDTSASA